MGLERDDCMTSTIRPDEWEELTTLEQMLRGTILDFNKTKEELGKTTLRVQIELLSSRLKRLKVSIAEMKKMLDDFCIPKEAKDIQNRLGEKLQHNLAPYMGTDDDGEFIRNFAWKTYDVLEQEKYDNLKGIQGLEEQAEIKQIYERYENQFLPFLRQPKKESRTR